MSRRRPLTCQTGKHFIVIRKNKAYPMHVLTDYLKNNYKQWCLICHKEDEDPITHLKIGVHYHFVGNHNNKDIRLSTAMNDLRKALHEETNNGLEVDQYGNLELALQYLLHKNNPEKTPHEFKELKYGGWTEEELKTFLVSEATGLNFDRVYNVCNAFDSIIDVIREIGFCSYHKYRATIRDIFDAIQTKKANERIMKDRQSFRDAMRGERPEN